MTDLNKSIPSLNCNKMEKIRMLLFTFKILAIFFGTIPILQYLFQVYNIDSVYSIYYISIILVAFSVIMLFLMFVFKGNEDNKFYKVLELLIFVIVFIISIYVSGTNESKNKYLFLFIIIAYTIEYGMRAGLVIAGIATGIIASMDLLLGDNTGVNIQFESDLALFAMFFLVAWTVGYYARLEKLHIENLIGYANIDGLTGAFNHRYFYEAIEKLFEDSRKNEDFKNFNYGNKFT